MSYSGATLALGAGKESNLVELRMLDARRVSPIPHERLPGVVNDLRGNDPRAWKTKIPTFERVRYPDLYPGISLDWYGNQRQLEYDFRVKPGADPTQIGIHVAGADGARIAGNGDLVIESGGEIIRQRAPIAFQPGMGTDGQPTSVDASFAVHGNTIRFKLGVYNENRPLIIDPLILGYSTYLGGTGSDDGQAIAVHGTGEAYITGWTNSEDFDTLNAIDGTGGHPRDPFVTKLNADGSALVWSTYLGGTGEDFGWDIAVDSNGAAYITGSTRSSDFSTANAIQPALSGLQDAFVTKLTRTGDALLYSTYLGGSAESSGNEQGRGIAVDSEGAAYITGRTDSTDFPTVEAIEGDSSGDDAFVTKLTPSGDALAYSTYLGGSSADNAADIAVDSEGAAYVTGNTGSTDFNTVNPIEGDSGGSDLFVSKLAPAGNALAYSTYLGGSSADVGTSIAVDVAGAAYVTGSTASGDFDKTEGGWFGDSGGEDAFVSMLNGAGDGLVYSTYLGGSGNDFGLGIAVDGGRNAYVVGDTRSSDFPTNTFGSLPPIDQYSGGGDAFVTKVNHNGNGLAYSTYLGGSQADAAHDVAVDSFGTAYVVGKTLSADFETSQPIEGPTESGGSSTWDVFVSGLAVNEEEILARRYQPILRLDEGERWRPLDVDRMLSDESHYVCEKSACTSLTSFNQLAEYTSSKAFIDIGAPGDPGPAPRYSDPDHYYSTVCPPEGGQIMDCESGPSSAIYYDTEKISPSGYRYIQYWIFYRFNDSPADDPPLEGTLDHEADWEQVAIAVPSATATSASTFDFANFGQHGTNFTYLRENLTCDADTSCGPTAKHVHGFVAGGTHATYAEPCSGAVPCFQSNSPYPETDHGGEVAWANNGDASALRRLPPPYEGMWKKGPRAWVDWPGWWGLDEEMTADRVASPANQSFYDSPWEAECVDDSGCQSQTSSAAEGEQLQLADTAVSSDRCGRWFGSGIAAISCDPSVLSRTLDGAEVGERSGHVELTLVRHQGRAIKAATTRGLAQLAAEPLRPGERLSIRGRDEHRGTLLLRSRTQQAATVASFSERQLSGRSQVVVERRGARAIPMLRQAGRPTLAPRSIAVQWLNGTVRKPSIDGNG